MLFKMILEIYAEVVFLLYSWCETRPGNMICFMALFEIVNKWQILESAGNSAYLITIHKLFELWSPHSSFWKKTFQLTKMKTDKWLKSIYAAEFLWIPLIAIVFNKFRVFLSASSSSCVMKVQTTKSQSKTSAVCFWCLQAFLFGELLSETCAPQRMYFPENLRGFVFKTFQVWE